MPVDRTQAQVGIILWSVKKKWYFSSNLYASDKDATYPRVYTEHNLPQPSLKSDAFECPAKIL